MVELGVLAGAAVGIAGDFLAGVAQNMAASAVTDLVRRRLQSNDAGTRALQGLEGAPQDTGRRMEAAGALADAAQDDPSYGQVLSDAVNAYHREVHQGTATSGSPNHQVNISGAGISGKGHQVAGGNIDNSKKHNIRIGIWAFAVLAVILAGYGATKLMGGSGTTGTSKTSADGGAGSPNDAGADGQEAPKPERGHGPGASTAQGTSLAQAGKDLAAILTTKGLVLCSGDKDWSATEYDRNLKKQRSFDVAVLDDALMTPAAHAGADAVVAQPCDQDQGVSAPGVSPVSPDGHRIAVLLNTNDLADGPRGDVGWLDVTTGDFRDLTQEAAKGGYSPETHSDQFPGFAPDGSFWFLRDGETFMSADDNGAVTKHKLTKSCNKDVTYPFFYQPIDNTATECQTVTPSGRYAAVGKLVEKGLADSEYGFELLDLSGRVDGFSKASLFGPDGTDFLATDGGTTRSCTPVSWLKESILLCLSDGNSFTTVRVDPSEAPADADGPAYAKVMSRITPTTNAHITQYALSGDRTALYVQQGDTVYQANLTHPGDPVDLGTAPWGNATFRGHSD